MVIYKLYFRQTSSKNNDGVERVICYSRLAYCQQYKHYYASIVLIQLSLSLEIGFIHIKCSFLS